MNSPVFTMHSIGESQGNSLFQKRAPFRPFLEKSGRGYVQPLTFLVTPFELLVRNFSRLATLRLLTNGHDTMLPAAVIYHIYLALCLGSLFLGHITH
jgi:hypothetical protein